MSDIAGAAGLFVVTAMAEIVDCLPRGFVVTQGRPAWRPTLRACAAGRTDAACGAVCAVVGLRWPWRVDGVMPTRWVRPGGIAGVAVLGIIALQPRATVT